MLDVRRSVRRGLVAALGVTLLVAAPAAAHPFVRGGELPVDSLATMTLAMAHGCGGDGGGEEEPTTEVALEVPDWLRIVEVAETDGYTSELETDADGTVTAVVWNVDGEGEPAPDFDLDVVATGTEGDERYLGVFQACAEGSYRWVGTPDEPADDPAIGVTLLAADPDSPAPPPDEAAVEEGPDEPAATEDAPTDETTTDAAPTDEPTTGEVTTDASPVEDDDPAAVEDPADDENGLGTVLLIALLVVMAVMAGLLFSRRRDASNGPDEDA